MRAGFTGGVLIDYPNSSKAKKSAHTHAVYSALMLYIQVVSLSVYWRSTGSNAKGIVS